MVSNNIGANASGGLVVNAVNESGMTALDVLLIFPSEAGDREIEEILRNSGARRARDLNLSINTVTSSEREFYADDHSLVNYFKFKRGRDSPSDARTALLVIAVLVTTATFQVGLNPPGGVWQDTSVSNSTGIAISSKTEPVHEAGGSILGSHTSVTYLIVMIFNTIGFSMSLYVISMLIANFPFQWEFQVCIIALYVTYNTSIAFMAPSNMEAALIAFSSAFPSTIPFIVNLVRRLINTIRGLFTYLKQKLVNYNVIVIN